MPGPSRTSRTSCLRRAKPARPSASRTSARSSWARTCAGASADLDGKGEVVSGIVVMRHGQNALDVIERVKAKTQGDRAGSARRREGCSHLRPLGSDPARHRQPEVHAHRGDPHGGARGLPLPLAHPQRHHPGDHHPGRGPALLHPLPDDGDHGQHHVAGRDRHRHRRAGGCGHRGGRADPQEPGAVGPDRPQGRLPDRWSSAPSSRWPARVSSPCW